MKVCSKCKENLPLSEFHKDSYKKDKLSTVCKVCRKLYSKKYYKDPLNSAKIKVNSAKTRDRAKKDPILANRILDRKKKWRRKWRQTPQGKLKENMSNSVRRRLKKRGGVRDASPFKSLPYSLQELTLMLESKFKPGMTWENYGEWHIDHIIPNSHFKYSSAEDTAFLECWNLSNLQPLWAEENLSKSNKII